MFTLDKIKNALSLLEPDILTTPLVRAWPLEKVLNIPHKVFLKCENLQVTNSFKARGAFCALSLCKDACNGVVTRSSGNFGYALAFAAFHKQIPCDIVVSDKISSIKKNKISSLCPNVHVAYSRKEEEKLAKQISEKENKVWLSPFNHEDVVLGQSTLGYEVYTQLPSIKHFIGPIGGGGLMGGSSLALKSLNLSIETIGLEPDKANDYFLSRKEGKKVELDHIETICEGLRAPSVGDITYPLLEKYLDLVETASDDQIKKALWLLFTHMGIIVEPSGAIGITSLFKKKKWQGDIVVVLSGANVDLDQFLIWIKDERNRS